LLGLGIAACLFGVVLILTRGHPGVLQDWTFTPGDLWARPAPLVGAEIAAGGMPPLHERTLPWVAALVLLTGIGAYLGYNVSLKRNGPVLTSATICLTPVYAAVHAMLLIGEKLARYHGVALALVVAGLLLVNRA
jgi:drug/metabolite transporter (DMT)-like permease